MVNVLAAGLLRGIAGAADENVKQLQLEAEEKRKRSYAALLHEYGQQDIKLSNSLISGREDKNFARDREAKKEDYSTERADKLTDYSTERTDKLSDYERALQDKRADQQTEFGQQKSLLTMKMEKEAKQEYKPGQALKEVAFIDKQIANINKGNMLSEDSMAEIIEKMPALAPFMNTKAEMSPEDKATVIKSLTEYKNYVAKFLPKSGIVTPQKDTVAEEIQSLLGK